MRKIENPIILSFIYIVMLCYAVFSVLPFLWALLQSFKTPRQANARTPLIFFEPTLKNYQELWIKTVPDNPFLITIVLFAIVAIIVVIGLNAKRLPIANGYVYLGIVVAIGVTLWSIPEFVKMERFYDYFLNTIIVTTGTITISISIGCLAGYALARYSGMSGVVILVAALGFRSLPSMAFILPYWWFGQESGLYDTHVLLIITLVAINQPFTIWMLRSFFMDIPRDIEESAMVDGASRFTAFVKCIIPIMWPGIISTALFTLLLAYSDFLLVRILTQSNWTLTVAISKYAAGEDPGHITLAAAAGVSATIPIMIIVFIFQKQLVKGLTAGAVKG
jgi:ABC-type glycerol-3-phosphate transport system permease component